MNSKRAKRAPRTAVDPVAIPEVHPVRASAVLSMRIDTETLTFILKKLDALGVKTPSQRQDFLRGSILAAITNSERAKNPRWQSFVKAIQAQAYKHLGAGLDLTPASEVISAGQD